MQRTVQAEFMDDEATGTIADLRENLRDLARINAWFGGTHSILRAIDELPVMPRTILDVGCGGADVPRAVLKHLSSRGLQGAHYVALDRSARVLSYAAAAVSGSDAISTVQGDATALPFEAGSFDLVTCSLALHHLAPAEAVQALSEMARVGAHVIVSDLRRSRVAWLAAHALLPLITRNRFTLHDGPLSVRRAYTPDEVRSMAQHAGWTRIEVRGAFGARLMLSGGR
jgi:ubiquinone/menaquinone biosynthesis C-methylase UbiE